MEHLYYDYLSLTNDNKILYNVTVKTECIFRKPIRNERGDLQTYEYTKMGSYKEIEEQFNKKLFDKAHLRKYKREINKHRLVYQLNENNEYRCRNIFYRYFLNNYFVKLPDEIRKRNGEYHYCHCENDNIWTEWQKKDFNFYKGVSQNIKRDIELLKRREPKFKYCIDKYVNLCIENDVTLYTDRIFKLFLLWKEHPECEFVIMSGNLNILNTESFFKMTDKEKREIIKFNNQHKNILHYYTSLQNIKRLMKAERIYNVSNEILAEMENRYEDSRLNLCIEDYFYLSKQFKKNPTSYYSFKDIAENYKDYKVMCKKLDKDISDPYHRYPTNLLTRHRKLEEQIARKENAERDRLRQERERAELEEIKERELKNTETRAYIKENEIEPLDYAKYIQLSEKAKVKRLTKYPKNFQTAFNRLNVRYFRLSNDKFYLIRKQYEKTVKKYLKYNTEDYKGYKIYIPDNIDEIAIQADALNQCLITCNYPNQIINKMCLLIFIAKDNKPYATVQLNKNAEIVQFHKNQRLENILPEKPLADAFNEWKIGKDFKLVA